MARFSAPSRLVAAILVLFAAAPFGRAAEGQPVAAEVAVDTSGGYARLVYRFNGDVDANVRMANGILVISFSVPVTLSIDRLSAAAAGYISAARRDPDGKGLRIALARKLTLHSMQADDKLFVDLLPETWKGEPPSLPADVVAELARRAREAERRERQIRLLAQQKLMVETPVRVARQPNFTRYVFELPDLVSVIVERNGDKLNLQVDAPLRFDLAEAKASLPPTIERIEAETAEQSTMIKFSLIGKADVRSFRDEKSYIIDIAPFEPAKPAEAPSAMPRAGTPSRNPTSSLTGLEVPRTVSALAQDSARDASRPAARPVPAPLAKDAETPPALAGLEPSPSMMFDPARQIEAANQSGLKPSGSPPAIRPKPSGERGTGVSAEAPAMPEPPEAKPPPLSPLKAPPAAQSQAVPADSQAGQPSPPKPMRMTPAGADIPAAPRDSNAVVKVEVQRQSDTLKLIFPFSAPTSGAVFRRGDTLWVVLDSSAAIDAGALRPDPARTIAASDVISGPDYQVVRIMLERPRLTSFSTVENNWIVSIGDAVLDPTQPIAIGRNVTTSAHAAAALAPFENPRALRRLTDPEVGDTLLVVTGFAPARGLLKEQDFVEFRMLASSHGLVVQPAADDIDVELSGDKVLISRPSGLALSPANPIGHRGYRPVVVDAEAWGFDRRADFAERQKALIAAAAAAPESARAAARFELARFYLAREMFPEAKGVLDVALGDDHPTSEDPTGLVMRAIAKIMMGRVEEGVQDLASPLVGDKYDAQLWRGLAYVQQRRWAEASDSFKKMKAAITTLPMELQRQVMLQEIRALIETRDFAAATDKLNEFESLGVPPEFGPRVAVLSGRVAEGLGHGGEALAAYRAAADSADSVSAARGRLLDIALRYQLGEMKRTDVISELETLTTFWRGDDTEIEALQLLAHLYTEEGRYREAFHVMRTAFKAHPNSELTRRIQDEAAATFDSLFLAGKGDAMPAVEALALFYDFRELTPIGRRGDEMVRRLTDRLVSVDLLDQAAELLQHQVDHRLQGAARAQVAARLAVIYLMNRKPDKALAVLRSTRAGDVAVELRNQRLLIEARALSDIGRHDVALDILSNMDGREAIRARADVLWAARRWGQAAEQIELLYGERWKDFEPLSEVERADLLRAAIGYALADDSLGLGRFREKYGAKMSEGPDRHAFEVATAPLTAIPAEFRDVVRQIASVDTLEGFLRELYARFPETGAFGPQAEPAPPQPAAAPGSAQLRRGDPARTGSVPASALKLHTVTR